MGSLLAIPEHLDGLYKRALEEGYQNYVKSGEHDDDCGGGGEVMKKRTQKLVYPDVNQVNCENIPGSWNSWKRGHRQK